MDESIGKRDCDETYPPLRDEWAGELEHAGEDAADEVAESGNIEPWEATACPVCRPGAVADGARLVRCVLRGGGDEAIQPTNVSVGGFRLAPDGAGS